MSLDTRDVEVKALSEEAHQHQVAATSEVDYGHDDRDETAATGVPTVTTALAAAASAAGAAWMVSSIFRDFAAHFVALGGVAIGIAVVIVAYRVARAPMVQYVTIPLALLVGSILVAQDARGGTTNTPSLVVDAIKAGGLLQPPISFDPGWRFILVVIFAMLASGAASVAISTRRPKLGVLIPLPVMMGAALIQPDTAEVLSTSVALICGVIGMTLAYGAELGGEGQLTASFQSRRALRGVAMAVALAVLVLGLSHFNVLFPQPNRTHVLPPQRPQAPPPEPDRPLLSYWLAGGRKVPLREGVIDVYSVKDGAWELPPFDVRRLDRVTPPHLLPGQKDPGSNPITLTVRIADAHGHQLPSLAGVAEIKSSSNDIVNYDPRTQALSLSDKPVYNGFTYTVLAPSVPSDLGKQLAASGKPEKAYEEFLQAPPPPSEVITLLTEYSQFVAQLNIPEDPYTRLQYLRTAFFQKVVAAGPGTPVDLPASRVAQMLNGGQASPYEITAAEALLARWAGVPSRIGYGYYGGDREADGSYTIRPKDGSTWLEVYFKGHGWTAITGIPPKAKPSTSQQQKNQQNIKASDQLALVVYVPVQIPTIKLLFEYVRFYLALLAPWLGAIILIAVCFPALLKLARARRRRRWGIRNGYPGRIAVAYAEFRDAARDLTIGDPAATPIEFLDHLLDDPEHQELAWLVTRSMWGDLRRDLREDDVAAAERLSKSLRMRMRQAQSTLDIVFALIARTSLQEPYSTEVPNIWPRRRPDLRGIGWVGSLARSFRSRRGISRRVATVGIATILSLLTAGCGSNATASARKIPNTLVPDALGDLTFQREPAAEVQFKKAGPEALVTEGRVYSIHAGDVIEGSVQVSLFKPSVDTSDINDEGMTQHCIDNPLDCTGHEAFKGIQDSIGTGRFQRAYVQGERTYHMALSDQFIYCWFPPDTETMVMLILRSQFTQSASDQLRDAIITLEHGRAPSPVVVPSETVAVPEASPGAGGLPGADVSPSLATAPSSAASAAPAPSPSPSA